jgi:hypothetical protein
VVCKYQNLSSKKAWQPKLVVFFTKVLRTKKLQEQKLQPDRLHPDREVVLRKNRFHFVFTPDMSEKPLFGLSFGQFTHKLSWLGYAKSLDNCLQKFKDRMSKKSH